ncbi:ABC transporter permease [Streptomyces sp. MA5143a]|uniref:ABC transporter permease n=1 Tax=Streptomyces sp. MA5143a TaxID=2083010 RepID=UPI000D19D942|nr:ABC transporter permease [Streptomyces sp. MA5143a]SPF04733.1 ABC-2 family transporter protein [Streptomyces sp. MA5143a]
MSATPIAPSAAEPTAPAAPAAPATPADSRAHVTPPSRRMVAVIVLIPVIAALALWAFAWPNARIAPRDLPLGVAGPAAAATQVEQRLEQRDGAFEVHRYADEAAARDAIEDRTVYGAVVVTEAGPKLLTASAASPMVAQLLQQAVGEQAAREGARVEVTDVVATPAEDPRGSAFGSSVLPLALAGTAAGAVVTLLGLRGARAAGALAGAAALVGLAAAALAHTWLGALTGDWWAEAGVLGLTTLAVGATVAGLAALLGRAGLGLGALLIVFLGNPFSGAASAPRMLPEPAGTLGQWLPPGAGATLLRSVSFFDGAAALSPALILTWWAVLGLGAVLVGPLLKRPKKPAASQAAAPTTGRTPAPTPAH